MIFFVSHLKIKKLTLYNRGKNDSLIFWVYLLKLINTEYIYLSTSNRI